MAFYCVAGIVIYIDWEEKAFSTSSREYFYHECPILPRSFRAFEMYDVTPDCADIIIKMCEVQKVKTPIKNKKVIGNQVVYENEEEICLGWKDLEKENRLALTVSINRDYSIGKIIPHLKKWAVYDLNRAQYIFEGFILTQGGFVLHGAAIEWNGYGIIFTGPSGAGKSTQAHLWKKYENALIINGDCPAIRKIEDKVYMYGTPWCGTSGECVDRRTEISVIVSIKQATQNSIRKLTGKEKYITVFSQIFRPSTDEGCLDLALENLKYCIEDFEVYELSCTKDERAVQLLKEEILANGNIRRSN